MGDLDDLDAIMGDTFSDDKSGRSVDRNTDAMPSRAEQWRPEDSTLDYDAGGNVEYIS